MRPPPWYLRPLLWAAARAEDAGVDERPLPEARTQTEQAVRVLDRLTHPRAPRPARTERCTLPASDGARIPVRLLVPAQPVRTPPPVWVYLHGGGWVLGSAEANEGFQREVAARAGCAIVAVDYRLAPEHPYPRPLEDCHDVVRWLTAHGEQLGVDGSAVAVGGESAGGNLAAALCLLARDRGGPAIAHHAVLCAPLDATLSQPSMQMNATGKLLSRREMERFTGAYLAGGADPRDPLVSPLLASDLAGLPPALVITAGHDPLRDEGDAYAARLREAGVGVTHLRYPRMLHGFVSLMPRCTREGAHAIDAVAAALRRAFAPGAG